jgi:phage gp29-like protein
VEPVTIGVERLVAYVHEREGGRWQGTSLLRPAYKHWLLKDAALRTWSQTIERNGMGVPHYTAADEEESLEAGQRLAQSYRAGNAAGGAGPHGSRMELLGVQGALPDIEALVRYHDQQIAASVLAQFMSLGQASGTGSYALGASFIDFFIMSLQSLAQLVADTATQHIVEDLVDVNFGTEVQAPRVVFDPIGQNPSSVVAAVQALITAGAIFPDPSLDAFVRQLVGLPPKAPLPGATTPAGAAEPPSGTPGT